MKRLLCFLNLCALGCLSVQATEKTDAALLLLQPSTARAAALGEAFSAVPNDIGAFHYNPATLATLTRGHASMLYKKGLSEDTLGHVDVGIPGQTYSWGLSAAYYDAGTVNVFNGVTSKTISAQKDYLFGLGFAQKMGRTSIGLKGQIFYSDLAETEKAHSAMIDFGVNSRLDSRSSIGGAIQNLGPSLNYGGASEDLPKIARVGFSAVLIPTRYLTSLLVDVPYNLNRHEVAPSLGIEVGVGPLAFRTGYRTGRSQEEFTVGMGFLWGAAALDYAFGLANKLDSTQQVSLSYRFDIASHEFDSVRASQPKKVELAMEDPKKKDKPKKTEPEINRQIIVMPQVRSTTYDLTPLQGAPPQMGIYTVREGDTLQSIAKFKYGFEGAWKQIYMANKHLIMDPENLKVGQKLLLPKSAQ